MTDHEPDTTAPETPVLEGRSLVKTFPGRRTGRWGGARSTVHAVSDVDVSLVRGQVTGLVGESGSGKSTVARLLAQLHGLTGGQIRLDGRPVRAIAGRAHRRYCRDVQLILQDPFASLNPTHTIRHHLVRPLRIHGHARTRAELDAGLDDLLARVNLTPPRQYLDKYPHELSGGQRQRVAIARALAARPRVLLADEPVSMLDVSIRLDMLNLLGRLQREDRLAILYVTHDIASARYFADRIQVMYAGRIVESGTAEQVTQSPRHPYTQLLVSAAPDPGRPASERPKRGAGEPPDLARPPAGCPFHPRCPLAMPVCRERRPPRVTTPDCQWADCWALEHR